MKAFPRCPDCALSLLPCLTVHSTGQPSCTVRTSPLRQDCSLIIVAYPASIEMQWVYEMLSNDLFNEKLFRSALRDVEEGWLSWADLSAENTYPTAWFCLLGLPQVKLVQHTYSCLFGTFLCNNAKERGEKHTQERTCSVWSLLRAGNKAFKNLLYSSQSEAVCILQPFFWSAEGIWGWKYRGAFWVVAVFSWASLLSLDGSAPVFSYHSVLRKPSFLVGLWPASGHFCSEWFDLVHVSTLPPKTWICSGFSTRA